MIRSFTIALAGIAALVSANFAVSAVAQEADAGSADSVADSTADSTTDSAADSAVNPNIAYLEENKAREGVIVRPSGLQIRILRAAEGDLVRPGGTAVVNYEGRLIDGTVFDSSYVRGQPARFPVDGVIEGWSEALVLMQVGAMWELVIPADIAYGETGAASGGIPPGATLIFKVELLGAM